MTTASDETGPSRPVTRTGPGRVLAGQMALQDGVVNRRQALADELGDHDVRRLLRRRRWAVMHPGVYVDHTGPATWRQRAWAAVLATEPAALFGVSALRAADGPGRRDGGEEGPVHVAVSRDRSVRAPDGVVVHRVAGFDDMVLLHTSPPRQRLEHAVLDVAARAGDELATVAVLADAVRARLTTAARLRGALATRTRLRHRALVVMVLDDVAAGTDSVLEHGYLVRVERAHGLPAGTRQVREHGGARTVYRDVVHEQHDVVVELDGTRFHEATVDRALDLERDLEAVVNGRVTLRLGWGQVFQTPCATARTVGEVLRRRGWQGVVRRCPRCPPEPTG